MGDVLKIIDITIEKFEQIWQGLIALTKKTLPSQESENKVGLIAAAYEPINDFVQAQKKKVNERHLVKAGAKQSLKDPHGYDRKMARLKASKIPIRLPKTLITKSDLPLVSDEDGDAKNREANAAIKVMLGPLYDWELDAAGKQLMEQSIEGASFDAIAAIAAESIDDAAPIEVRPVPEAASVEIVDEPAGSGAAVG